MGIEIRDMRNGDWCWINRAVVRDPHLTAADVRAYAALSSYGGCAEIRPSMSDIAVRACLGERTAKRAISNLERVGYIQVHRRQGRGKANRYDLLKAVKGCRFCTLLENVPKTTEKGDKRDRKGVPEMTPKEDNEEDSEINNPLHTAHSISSKALKPVEHEDDEAFVQEMAVKIGIRPERVRWRMARISLKANGTIRSLAYFRAAFPDFNQRERFELIDHLTQLGADSSRQNPRWGIPDLIEELKCEAARIGFDDYSDAVSTAIRNLRRGVRDSRQ